MNGNRSAFLGQSLGSVGRQRFTAAKLQHLRLGRLISARWNAFAHVHQQCLCLGPAVHAHGAWVPGQDAAIQVLHGDGVARITHDNRQAQQLVGFKKRIARFNNLVDVHKRKHGALDHVIQRAVRQDAHHVPLASRGLHLDLFGYEGIEHSLHIWHQPVIVHQVGDGVTHWSAGVAWNQIDDLGY